MPVSAFQRVVKEGLMATEPVSVLEVSAETVDVKLVRQFGPKIPTHNWRRIFLDALSAGQSVQQASVTAGIHFVTAYRARRNDAKFRKRWNEALDIQTRMLAQEAQRRAYHGTEEDVYYKGQVVGSVRRYSDNLLMFVLKKRDPSYRDATHQVNVGVGVRVDSTGSVFGDVQRDMALIQGTGVVDGVPMPADTGVNMVGGVVGGHATKISDSNPEYTYTPVYQQTYSPTARLE